ncbi:MAG: glycosyltransferase family 2 protein [Sulfobacillus sp.]
MTVSVVFPAHNEADMIAASVKAAWALPGVVQVIVVDDGSSDGTATLARAGGAEVVSLSTNVGKAEALRLGVGTADADVVLTLDADLGESVGEASRLLAAVDSGAADLAIATFPKQAHRGGFGLVVGLARWGIRHLTGKQMHAPLSGQRACRRQALSELGDLGRGWQVEVRMTIQALRRGLTVVEVETQMSHRATGRRLRDFWHRGGQFVGVVQALWNCWHS